MTFATFTDKQLVVLYRQLVADYKRLEKQHTEQGFDTAQMIYWELYQNFCAQLAHDSQLQQLPAEEQKKAWNVFYSVFYAQNLYRNLSTEECRRFQTEYTELKAQRTENVRVEIYQYGAGIDDLFFTGYALGILGGHHHSGCSDYNADGETLAVMLVVLAALILLVLTIFASYYILTSLCDSVERIYYNESWMKAIGTLAAVAAGATAGATIGYFVLTPLILGLTLANPAWLVALSIAATVSLTLILAGTLSFVATKLENYVIEKANPNSLDPKDPHRFEISKAEEEVLLRKDFNIETVKCAIVALRLSMDTEQVPSFLSRISLCASNEHAHIQECLMAIRALKHGSYPSDTINVGGMTFYLKMPSVTMISEAMDEHAPQSYHCYEPELMPIYEPRTHMSSTTYASS